jgi:dolichol-phosphate mannosyltransferase
MTLQRSGEPNTALADLRLAIVCPMANEIATAVDFVEELLAEASHFREAIFFAVLDNVSSDGTLDRLRGLERTEPRLRVVWAPENRSVVDAYTRGYREALATGFEWILEVDAGFSHKPSDLRNFLPHLNERNDCVFGSRFCPGGRISDNSFKRYLLSRGGTILSNLLLGTRLSDMTSGYQMFQRSALKAVMERGIDSRGPFFQTEIKAYCHRMRIVEVPIHYRSASHNITGPTIGDAFRGLAALFRRRIAGTLCIQISEEDSK